MDDFLKVHADVIEGTLTMFDRLIFRGYLSNLFPDGAFARFLSANGVLLKDFSGFVQQTSAELKVHVEQMAADAGRPYEYLASATTKASGKSKEDLARAIAERDHVTEGLICVFAVVEPCQSFMVQGHRAAQKLVVTRKRRKCLHFYLYFLDAEFGFMHVRLQSWFPFDLQAYINGREWVAQRLSAKGLTGERYDNTFLHLQDPAAVQALCDDFAHREWPRVLDAFARKVNPKLAQIETSGFGGYYWTIYQAEIATDVMFKNRASLLPVWPDLRQAALVAFSAEDVLRFLGRKLHGNFKGEVHSDLKKRPEGWRIKHWMKGNAIKMYDKFSVLRIETTINNAREFKVLKTTEDTRRWVPMGKGVANFWRYYQVGQQANQRYLGALAHVQLKGEAVAELDGLCRRRTKDGKHYAKFNPVSAEDCDLFAAVMAGEHTLNGFRNHNVVARLYQTVANSAAEAKRRCARVSRLIAKLRGHGLVAKVKDARLYRVTERGCRLMSAALALRREGFPQAAHTA